MSDQAPRDFDWPTRRWLLWGVIGVAAVVLIVIFFANLGDEITEDDPAAEAGPGTEETLPDTGEQVEWTIEVSYLAPAPGSVVLRGDEPLGAFIETWKDGVMVARSADANLFAWDMDAELPEPVIAIDDAGSDCDALNALLNDWANQTAEAFGEAQQIQAESFAQYAFDTLNAQGCEPNLEG